MEIMGNGVLYASSEKNKIPFTSSTFREKNQYTFHTILYFSIISSLIPKYILQKEPDVAN